MRLHSFTIAKCTYSAIWIFSALLASPFYSQCCFHRHNYSMPVRKWTANPRWFAAAMNRCLIHVQWPHPVRCTNRPIRASVAKLAMIHWLMFLWLKAHQQLIYWLCCLMEHNPLPFFLIKHCPLVPWKPIPGFFPLPINHCYWVAIIILIYSLVDFDYKKSLNYNICQ